MALADRLAERSAPRPPEPCPLGKLLAELDGAELQALKVMLGTPEKRGWTAPEIYADLQAEGYTVGFKAINKHRGGTCRCAS